MTAMLYIIIVSAVAVILAFFVDWGHKDELELNSNIIGYGKAKGLYIINMENYYVVAGVKVKSKRKAVREFMKLVEENGFLPPGMYFKTFKVNESKNEPTVRINKEMETTNKRQEQCLKQDLRREPEAAQSVRMDKPTLKPAERWEVGNSRKFKRR